MEITIQRDGRIAINEHGEDLRYADQGNPLAIFSMFRARTVFEEGLTLRQLMKALRPWQDVLSKTAWMNFDAWLTAADKTLISSADDRNIDEEIIRVEIYCMLDLYRSDDGTLQMGSHWDFHGKFAKPVDLGSGHLMDTCGLSFTSPKEFANVPVVINSNPHVHDIAVGPPDGKRPILSEASPGVYDRIELTPTLFETVILGLLDNLSFYGDPEDTDDKGQEIAGMVEAIKTLKETLPAKDANSQSEGSETSPGLRLVHDADETDGFIEMDMDEFDAAFGLKRDRQREDATFKLARSLKKSTAPEEELAAKLKLSVLGLHELKQGITAHFSTEYLIEATDIIDGSEAAGDLAGQN